MINEPDANIINGADVLAHAFAGHMAGQLLDDKFRDAMTTIVFDYLAASLPNLTIAVRCDRSNNPPTLIDETGWRVDYDIYTGGRLVSFAIESVARKTYS